MRGVALTHLECGRLLMKKLGLIVLLALSVGGCRSRAELTKALAESKAAEAQKDSLLTEVLETTQFVSDLNSELAKTKAVSEASDGSDRGDRKSTRLNSSHPSISYAVFCLKKKSKKLDEPVTKTECY